MANTTESKETVSRKEFATYLRNLADQFESEGDAEIRIGNKSVTVHPARNVRQEVTVIERSAILRGDKEAFDLEVKWKKSDGTKRSDDESEDDGGLLGNDDDGGLLGDDDDDDETEESVDENGSPLGSDGR